MKILTPIPNKPGTWQNPNWTAGSPGLFALVIGVSDYKHLDPTDPTTLNMGKLAVSALTAYAFFEWLDSSYMLDGVPLAKCWFLAAPTAAELAAQPGLAQHSHLPDFDACQLAILEWFAEMKSLPEASAVKSRSVFFFSGHGLEVTEEIQVLLPSDYLRPPVPQYERAIGTYNLRRGLKALKVPLHHFFLDACRNDHENLRQADPIEGTRILTPVVGAAKNPNCYVSVFFATASGRQAFQPSDPSKGTTLFGSALLEGLSVKKGMRGECDDTECLVKLDPLLVHCRSRIPAIAREDFSQTIEQEVRISGDYSTEVVCQIQRKRSGGLMNVEMGRGAFRESLYSNDFQFPAPIRPLDFSEGHPFFGSETTTIPFVEQARVFREGEWVTPGTNDYTMSRARHGSRGGLHANEVVMNPGANSTSWFEILDIAKEKKIGVVLPADGVKLNYEFEFDVEGHSFTRFACNLSWDNPEPYRMVANAWKEYRNSGMAEALYFMLAPESATALEHVLGASGTQSCLSAAIATLLLVRSRHWERLHDWPRNLANWFPDFSDGCVLWAEQLLLSNGDPQEALQYLMKLKDRRLPVLSPVLAMAYSRLREFQQETSPPNPDLDALVNRLRLPVLTLRSGGLFTVFIGEPNQIGPELVELK